jgi:hypothetical protein
MILLQSIKRAWKSFGVIKAHYSFLPAAITKLETQGMQLVDCFKILSDAKSAIASVPGVIGQKVLEKLNSVLKKNPGKILFFVISFII